MTGNDWVAELLKKEYNIISPAELIQAEKRIELRATLVRIEMAKNGDWQRYVPEEIAKYIQEKRLDERFRKEFSIETLAKAENKDYTKPEDAWAERMHTLEV